VNEGSARSLSLSLSLNDRSFLTGETEASRVSEWRPCILLSISNSPCPSLTLSVHLQLSLSVFNSLCPSSTLFLSIIMTAKSAADLRKERLERFAKAEAALRKLGVSRTGPISHSRLCVPMRTPPTTDMKLHADGSKNSWKPANPSYMTKSTLKLREK